MIARIWCGYTTSANSDTYEKLLKKEVFTSIDQKQIKGYLGIQLLKRYLGTEVEFKTIMLFEGIESVKLLAGDSYKFAYVPASAKILLSRFDKKSTHFEMIHELSYVL